MRLGPHSFEAPRSYLTFLLQVVVDRYLSRKFMAMPTVSLDRWYASATEKRENVDEVPWGGVLADAVLVEWIFWFQGWVHVCVGRGVG